MVGGSKGFSDGTRTALRSIRILGEESSSFHKGTILGRASAGTGARKLLGYFPNDHLRGISVVQRGGVKREKRARSNKP